MKNVLVVDADRALLDGLAVSLSRFKSEFTLRTAESGEQAVSILQDESIQLLVTALDLPAMDGFELLAWVLQDQPGVDIIVMGTADAGRIGKTLTAEGAFQYILKPVAAQVLLDLIREFFAERAKGHLRGLSLSGFLQFLNSERRSCSLAVRSGNQTGYIELFEGEVINAVHGETEGRLALFQVLSWEQPAIDVEAYHLTTRKRIDAPLARLLLEAAVGSDLKDLDQNLFSHPELAASESRTATPPENPRSLAEKAGPPEETPALGGFSADDRPPEPVPATAEISAIREGLKEITGLRGAIGAALLDMNTSACLASASHDPDAGFDQAALRAGEVALARLNSMVESSPRETIRQMKLHSTEEFELVRFFRSKPHLLLYFVGERGRADPEEASTKLAELESLIG